MVLSGDSTLRGSIMFVMTVGCCAPTAPNIRDNRHIEAGWQLQLRKNRVKIEVVFES